LRGSLDAHEPNVAAEGRNGRTTNTCEHLVGFDIDLLGGQGAVEDGEEVHVAVEKCVLGAPVAAAKVRIFESVRDGNAARARNLSGEAAVDPPLENPLGAVWCVPDAE
jgi:hypothetical protein